LSKHLAIGTLPGNEYRRKICGADQMLDVDSEFMNIDVRLNAIDSLETATAFLQWKDHLKWKWVAIAIHHALHSFCVGALECGNPDWVISSGSRTDDVGHFWRRGDEKRWSKSERVKFGNGPAYRIAWHETDEQPYEHKGKTRRREDLISFWTALARIQDDRWMGRSVVSRPVRISDEELKAIQWLALRVRNELVHFVPKFSGISIDGIWSGCQAALDAIESLVFESNTLWHVDAEGKDRIRIAIAALRQAKGGAAA
jgi:hypothetical protein